MTNRKYFAAAAGVAASVGSNAMAQPNYQLQNLPLTGASNSCVNYSNQREAGQNVGRLKLTSRCSNVTALVCVVRASSRRWDCRGRRFDSSGNTWLMPFQHGQSSVYYVGACRANANNCHSALGWLYAAIDGRPGPAVDPARMAPSTTTAPGCGFTVDGRCLPPRIERG